MRRFGESRAPEICTEALQRLLDENRELRKLTHRQQEGLERLRYRVEELETLLKGDGRRPPPPAFVKPNVKKDPSGTWSDCPISPRETRSIEDAFR